MFDLLQLSRLFLFIISLFLDGIQINVLLIYSTPIFIPSFLSPYITKSTNNCKNPQQIHK